MVVNCNAGMLFNFCTNPSYNQWPLNPSNMMSLFSCWLKPISLSANMNDIQNNFDLMKNKFQRNVPYVGLRFGPCGNFLMHWMKAGVALSLVYASVKCGLWGSIDQTQHSIHRFNKSINNKINYMKRFTAM